MLLSADVARGVKLVSMLTGDVAQGVDCVLGHPASIAQITDDYLASISVVLSLMAAFHHSSIALDKPDTRSACSIPDTCISAAK